MIEGVIKKVNHPAVALPVGSKCANLVPRQADAENRAMYLESSSPANNAYYKKFGFEIRKEISLKRGASPVPLYIMVREPQPSKVA
jgi:hypothetical protein